MKNKTQLDFEPKTSHDFVINLELLDTMETKIAETRYFSLHYTGCFKRNAFFKNLIRHRK